MKRFVGFCSIIALASSVHVADAGQKLSASVIVSGGVAMGSLGSARNLGPVASTGQFIGCQTIVTNGTSTGMCSARDTSFRSLSCTTTNTELIRAMRSITGDTYIYFETDGVGTCTSLYVYNYSYYEPKQP